MRKTIIGEFDSFNLSHPNLLSILKQETIFIIHPIKIGSNANEAYWFQKFGKPLFNNTDTGRWGPYEAYIVFGANEVAIPLKIFKHGHGISPIIQFAGLQRYDDKSIYLRETLHELIPILQEATVSRIDIAIDIIDPQIIKRVETSLKARKRIPKKEQNTTYWRTTKQRKKRSIVNILSYSKGKKEGWSNKNVIRFEFQFSAEFFRGLQIHDFKNIMTKMENRIQKEIGLCIKILSPSSKLIPEKDIKTHLSDIHSLLEENILGKNLTKVLNLEKELKKKPNRKKYNYENHLPTYMTTEHMAHNIDTSSSFLEKNIGKLFTEGVHFYRHHSDARLIRWNVQRMHNWIEGKYLNSDDKALVKKLLA